MKIIQAILNKLKDTAFTWKVPSVSNYGSHHQVSFGENIGWKCDCIAFSMSGKKRMCKHIQLVKMNYDGSDVKSKPVIKLEE